MSEWLPFCAWFTYRIDLPFVDMAKGLYLNLQLLSNYIEEQNRQNAWRSLLNNPTQNKPLMSAVFDNFSQKL